MKRRLFIQDVIACCVAADAVNIAVEFAADVAAAVMRANFNQVQTCAKHLLLDGLRMGLPGGGPDHHLGVLLSLVAAGFAVLAKDLN